MKITVEMDELEYDGFLQYKDDVMQEQDSDEIKLRIWSGVIGGLMFGFVLGALLGFAIGSI